ncbi:MAG: hypothetical protein A3D31_08210 [Candidatus Fluviicola riflensis]|nr:MAG: hypothetical protein A3D31_08210 [Candidatus Fluviicola riflensis]OGS82438.1 MAG: hypothetical protein A2724_17155 [Fluviicola sp. RIFCSPHIGHO2_01_FULL_43_53]
MSKTEDTVSHPTTLGEEMTHIEFEHVTFDLPHGTFHALQGGDPNGQLTIFLHGFPDHPPTLLQLYGANDGCILPAQVDDRYRFASQHAMEIFPDTGHFLHIEAPEEIAERIAAWSLATLRNDTDLKTHD